MTHQMTGKLISPSSHKFGPVFYNHLHLFGLISIVGVQVSIVTTEDLSTPGNNRTFLKPTAQLVFHNNTYGISSNPSVHSSGQPSDKRAFSHEKFLENRSEIGGIQGGQDHGTAARSVTLELEQTDNVMSGREKYGNRSQLYMLLAQEEAKCLDDFGQLEPGPWIGTRTSADDKQQFLTDFFRPLICRKGSRKYAECEQCSQSTTVFSREANEPFRGCHKLCSVNISLPISSSSCWDRCIQIQSNVQTALRLHKSRVDEAFSGAVNGAYYYDGHVSSKLCKVDTNCDFNNEGTNRTGKFDKNRDEATSQTVQLDSNSASHVFTLKSSVFCEGVTQFEPQNKAGAIEIRPRKFNSFPHFLYLKSVVLLDSKVNKEKLDESDRNQTGSEQHVPVVFVIEQRELIANTLKNKNNRRTGRENGQEGRWSPWKTLGKSPYGFDILRVDYHQSTYEWRVTAVGTNGLIGTDTVGPFTTINGYVEPGQPKRVYVIETKAKDGTVDVLLGWDPPEERACFYKIVLESRNEDETGRVVRIKGEPLGVHKFWFLDLKFDFAYEVRITSRSADWDEDESTHAGLSFNTPACLEVHQFRFDKCAPPPPRNLSFTYEAIKLNTLPSETSGSPTSSGSTSGSLSPYKIHLRWEPPRHTNGTNLVSQYVVAIRAFNWNVNSSSLTDFTDPHLLAPLRINLPGNVTEVTVDKIRENVEYTILVTAVSSKGSSPPATLIIKLPRDETLEALTITWWMYSSGILLVALISLVTCQFVRIVTRKRKIKAARDSYFKSIDQRDAFSDQWSIVSLTEEYNSTWKVLEENFPREKWDIGLEDLAIGDVIGQGAFGIVKKAKLGRRKYTELLNRHKKSEAAVGNMSTLVETTGLEINDKEIETVAVKMLKVAATAADRTDLMKELMTMQSLGRHPQIVTLLGVCNTAKSMCLVMEYCPGGDLLTFLRKFREKFMPLLNIVGSSNTEGVWCMNPMYNNTVGRADSLKSTNRRSWMSDSDTGDVCYTDVQHQNEHSICSAGVSEVELEVASKEQKIASSDDKDCFECVTEEDVLSYARQIALGMAYLERNHIIHRDLACRNILVMGDHKHVKISDFGLSRDIYTWNVYRQKTAGKLPFKWMALESITSRIFTSKSDVWSYGIVLWELVTLGAIPYPALENQELFNMLKSGYRMESPDNCSDELYALMRKCWRTAPADRPNFTELCSYLEAMMENKPDMYLTLHH